MLETAVQTFEYGAHVVRLHVPQDFEGMVERMTEVDFGPDERMPYWAKLWPGAFALAEYQAGAGRLEGTRVLELGCGLALNGVLAAQLGGAVTVTDWYKEALVVAAENARLNGVEVKTVWMDWNEPPVDHHYDLVLGADILYERRNAAPVLGALRVLLAEGGRALLSDPGRPHLGAFLEDAKRTGWKVEVYKVGEVNVVELRA